MKKRFEKEPTGPDTSTVDTAEYTLTTPVGPIKISIWCFAEHLGDGLKVVHTMYHKGQRLGTTIGWYPIEKIRENVG